MKASARQALEAGDANPTLESRALNVRLGDCLPRNSERRRGNGPRSALQLVSLVVTIWPMLNDVLLGNRVLEVNRQPGDQQAFGRFDLDIHLDNYLLIDGNT
jgi:hypothetical protein